MILKEGLLEFNRRGLIHAPDEPDEIFFRRCQAAPSRSSLSLSSFSQELFDINPDWVEVVYGNKGLRIWEGGCTWIDSEHITLQLNKAFLNKKSYFGYTQEEIVAHELVHVVRGSFEEPIFEEILAYQTSPSFFRRFFGPFFRTPKESLILIGLLFAYCLATCFETFQAPLFTIFISLIAWGLFRLLKAQTIFNRARKKLQVLVTPKKVLAVMLRLTDREIIRFSKMPQEEIAAYAQKMAKITLRWQQITSAYFFFGL